MVNRHCQKATCEVQACPTALQPAFGNTAAPGACAGAFTPGSDAGALLGYCTAHGLCAREILAA